ncbi:30S ribosomal protein S16 [Hymenobacter baengnokdamensis]|uniref:30S ribosomal protein S16 n=1 Tax=Hymenobacter baengnokdamensis TaxID=2615203 RepID=UPI0012493924|nr:30S ribosomal protein S16 [Hymenobacter baengnokdamensis]
MAVKIRLARRGRKKAATYDIVVADARAPRDGRFVEKLGTYNPNTNPATIVYDADRAFYWVMNGAQPTETVRAMLAYRGVLLRRHLQLGVTKGALTQEVADQRYQDWLSEKDAKIEAKKTGLTDTKAEARKQQLAAETKVKEARATALAAKQAAALAAATPAAPAEAAATEGTTETAETSAEAAA